MDQLVRYSIPTRYDNAPRGTICKVVEDGDNKYKLYVQIEEDSAKSATWISMGDLLELTFKDFVQDSEFVEACVNLCQSRERKCLKIISDKLKI